MLKVLLTKPELIFLKKSVSNSQAARNLIFSCLTSYPSTKFYSIDAKNQVESLIKESPKSAQNSGRISRTVQLKLSGSNENATVPVNAIWLRENCKCATCYTAFSHQRNVLFHHLPPASIVVKSLHYNETSDKLTVIWSDGHESPYCIKWLRRHLRPKFDSATHVRKVMWNAKDLKIDSVKHTYESFMRNESSLADTLVDLLKWGVALVTNCPNDPDVTQKAVERLSFIQQTLYGTMYTFTNDKQKDDTAYTNIAIGAHTDCSYLTYVPGIQVFHCLYHDGDGGETLLVDGFNAAKILRNKNPQAFQLLLDTPVYHSHKETRSKNRVHLRHLTPILGIEPRFEKLQFIRYNPYDREALTTVSTNIQNDFYDALAELSRIIEDPANEVNN